jgi:hypothetical protein
MMTDDTPPAETTDPLEPESPRSVHILGVSKAQQRQSKTLTPDRLDPHTAVNLEAKQAKRNRSHLTGLTVASLQEQQQLATRILRRFGDLALTDPTTKLESTGKPMSASALKNFATAWGIASDKLTILQGRPTQILRVEESEEARPAVWELARKLARVNQTPVQSEQPPTDEKAG